MNELLSEEFDQLFERADRFINGPRPGVGNQPLPASLSAQEPAGQIVPVQAISLPGSLQNLSEQIIQAHEVSNRRIDEAFDSLSQPQPDIVDRMEQRLAATDAAADRDIARAHEAVEAAVRSYHSPLTEMYRNLSFVRKCALWAGTFVAGTASVGTVYLFGPAVVRTTHRIMSSAAERAPQPPTPGSPLLELTTQAVQFTVENSFWMALTCKVLHTFHNASRKAIDILNPPSP